MAQPQVQTTVYEPLWRVRLRLFWRGFRDTWQIFKESKVGIIGLVIIIFFGLLAAAHPIMIEYVWDPQVYDPVIGYDFDIMMHPAPPSAAHLLGTDPLGRDVLSQLMYSAREEFLLGVVAAVITVVIGTTVGTAAAYFGGWVDTLFMRFADLILLFPFIPFMIVISSLADVGLLELAVILGILGGFGGITIILKSQALSIKVRPYIEAAKVTGGSHWWVIRKHIIPNVMPLSFLYMMFNVTGAIVTEATLSFFGLLNVHISWGLMIHTAQVAGYLLQFDKYWWLWLPSGLSVTLLCAAFYLVGRGLDEVVNPRLRKR